MSQYTLKRISILCCMTTLLWGNDMIFPTNVSTPIITTIDGKTDNPSSTTDNRPEIIGTCEEGTVVTVQVDNIDISPSVRCSYDKTFILVPTVDITDGIHDITAKQTDSSGNISQSSPIRKLGVNVNIVPDYEISLVLDRTTIFDKTTPIQVIITISEFQYGINEGDFIFTLTKNKNLNIVFDNELSTLQGYTLSNNQWEMLNGTLTSYQLRYKANKGKYPGHTRMRIGLKGTFTPPENSRGKFTFNARIKLGTGDTNTKNNKDSDTMIFSNIK